MSNPINVTKLFEKPSVKKPSVKKETSGMKKGSDIRQDDIRQRNFKLPASLYLRLNSYKYLLSAKLGKNITLNEALKHLIDIHTPPLID